jgi:carbamoyltransferase
LETNLHGTFRYILGIQSFANSDSGAAIVRTSLDGEVLDYVAISEERLIRKKYPYTFPLHSLGYCMEHFDLDSLDQIDVVVTDNIRIKRWFRSGPSYPGSDFDYIKAKLDVDPRKIVVIGYHEAHAASTFYTSGFPSSAIMVVDGNGSDVETNSYYRGSGERVEFLDRYRFQGIGTCYSEVTNWILSLGTGGEGKTMGLPPYGEPYEPVLDFGTELDGIKTDFSRFTRRLPMSDVMNHGSSPEKLNPLTDRCRDPMTMRISDSNMQNC